MQILLLLFDLVNIDQLLEHRLVLQLNSLSALQSDIVLKVVIWVDRQHTAINLFLFTKIVTDRIAVELTLVHLKG